MRHYISKHFYYLVFLAYICLKGNSISAIRFYFINNCLGIFGRDSVFAANVWPLQSVETFMFGAFRIFRNYDGAGAAFGDTSFSATASDIAKASVYSSQDAGNANRVVTVLLNNLGSQTWPSGGANPVQLDLHFTTVPGGSAAMSKWLTSQIFTLPSDVAPGGSVAVTVSAKAPSTSASVYLEAQMFKNKQFWFQQWNWSEVSVGSLAWGANYNLCAAPRTWTGGQSQTFQLTMTNGGSATWPATGTNSVRLNLHFTSRQGGSAAMAGWLVSYSFPLAADVAPGGSATLTVTIAVPSTAGPMYLEATLFKNHEFWFQQWQGVPVTVG